MKVIAINYADRGYFLNQKNNSAMALRFGATHAVEYNVDSIDSEFRARYADILSANIGAGYWLWKPYIIWKTLISCQQGDVVVYTDSGSNFIGDFTPLVRLCLEEDVIVFELEQIHKERMWSKKQCFEKMNLLQPQYTDSPQRLAGFQLHRRCQRSIEFVSEWLHWCTSDRLITDDITSANFPEFREHRRDQSLLSLTSKKWAIAPHRDPCQYGNPLINDPRYPNDRYPQLIDSHRRKD